MHVWWICVAIIVVGVYVIVVVTTAVMAVNDDDDNDDDVNGWVIKYVKIVHTFMRMCAKVLTDKPSKYKTNRQRTYTFP